MATKNFRRKGSIIIAVLIITAALTLALASFLKLGMHEHQMNHRHFLRQQATLAAESFADLGIAEKLRQFERETSLNNDQPTLPSTALSWFEGSNVVIGDAEIFSSMATEMEKTFISDPDDPLYGKYANVQTLDIYGKATAQASGLSSTQFVKKKVEVRDSPLFSNAIFYNMDLELHPGPRMVFDGPVHSNEDLWLQAIGGLEFTSKITAAGRLLHGSKKQSEGAVTYRYLTDEHGSPIVNEDGTQKRVKEYHTENIVHTQDGFVRIDGKDMDRDPAGWKEKWLYNGSPEFPSGSWFSMSKNLWGGLVEDKTHGTHRFNPTNIPDFVPDDPYTANNEQQNHGYALIEPVLSEKHPDYKGADVRKQKIAWNAGLILRIDESTGRVRAFRYEKNSEGQPVIDEDSKKPVEVEVYVPRRLIGDVDENYERVQTASGTLLEDREESFAPNSPEPYTNDGDVIGGIYDHRNDIGLDTYTIDIEYLRYLVDDTYKAEDLESGASKLGSSDGQYVKSRNNRGKPASQLKDHWDDGQNTHGLEIYDPVKHWNGVLYVEFAHYGKSEDDPSGQRKEGSFQRLDKAVTAKSALHDEDIGGTADPALQVINGTTIPYPQYLEDNANERGMTLATNGPMYLVGNYNADGNQDVSNIAAIEKTRDAYKNRDGDYRQEPPAGLASDTLSVLSTAWPNNRPHSAEGNVDNREAAPTEISAGIITGLRPTVPDDADYMTAGQSGGAHNFPRFLEKWRTGSGKVSLQIRGSLVALWESEMHELPMPDNFSHYYGAPQRNWGYNENFASGVYPPGIPTTRDFALTAFVEINEREYNAARADWGTHLDE